MAKMKQVRQNKAANKPQTKARLIASNKKARHDYLILDEYEAGMVLTGTEVKSLREGRASLAEGFCSVDRRGEVWAENLYIPEYLSGSWTNHTARRKRKLLLHRDEIAKIQRKMQEAGTTIVPLRLYFNEDGRVKLEIATARGKKEYDKRHTLREQQDAREAQREMRLKNRGVQG
ncbi:SsrA-binding protein SmpB [Micrococcoides hystricis]|uniref:SsrA-binding protein n=1 Tax=Micrococcoides hystricis TaxID=1572761 RepID=A0ABV6P9X3_9MICC